MPSKVFLVQIPPFLFEQHRNSNKNNFGAYPLDVASLDLCSITVY